MSETWWRREDQLDETQKEIIALPGSGNHLVIGPPGSGKTNLLLLRANYIYQADKSDIRVIVFTRTLREFIVAGGVEYKFPANCVRTCSKWQQELLYQYDEPAKAPNGTFEAQRHFYLDRVSRLIEKRHLQHIHDVIFLDEAQDYWPQEIDVFEKLAKELFVVADARQKIYSGPDPLERLTQLVGGNVHRLRYHYRCGTKICEIADALSSDANDYDMLVPTSNYDEARLPCTVDYAQCSSIDEQADLIAKALRVQHLAYPDELIGVVCPRRADVRSVWAKLVASGFADKAMLYVDDQRAEFDINKPIYVSTLHAAKGLEFRALHIAGCEFLSRFRHQRNMAYTAVTRAKTSLNLYCCSGMPTYLEKALTQACRPRTKRSIKGAFGIKE